MSKIESTPDQKSKVAAVSRLWDISEQIDKRAEEMCVSSRHSLDLAWVFKEDAALALIKEAQERAEKAELLVRELDGKLRRPNSVCRIGDKAAKKTDDREIKQIKERLQALEAGTAGKATFSMKEFCEWSGIGRTFAFNEMREGRLVFKKVGHRTLIPRIDAEAWLAQLPRGALK